MADKTIFAAIRQNDLMTLSCLLADTDAEYHEEDSPLICAIRCGNWQAFELILAAIHVNLDSINAAGETALMVALRAKNALNFQDKTVYFSMVRALIMAGADCNIADFYDDSPLTIAASFNDRETTKLLIEHNEKLSYRNKALDNACYYGHIEIVRLLIGTGMIVDMDTNLVTSMFVSRSVREDIIKMLSDAECAQINLKIDFRIRRFHSISAIELAMQHACKKKMNLLSLLFTTTFAA